MNENFPVGSGRLVRIRFGFRLVAKIASTKENTVACMSLSWRSYVQC